MTRTETSRAFGITLFCLAIPALVWSCADDDDPPAQGQAGEGSGGQPEGAGGDGGSAAAVTICGLSADVSGCDPVTAAGCDVASGSTCDYDFALTGFACFPDSQAPAGAACDNATVFCGPGMLCLPEVNVCVHYCCDASDCTEGRCQRGYLPDGDSNVGVCDQEYGGDCVFGTGGAASDCEGGGGAAGGGAGGQGGNGGQGGGAGEGGTPLP